MKKIRYRFLPRSFSFVVLLLLPVLTLAQTATVQGVVTDKEGLPVPLVYVFEAGSANNYTLADTSGHFSIIITAEKETQLVFKNPSFEEQKINFKLNANELRKIRVELVFKNELSAVDITYEKNRHTENIYIQPKEYFRLPGANADISRLILAQGLGVQSSNELSTSYSVRGGNFDENLVYVNDIEVYRPFLIRSGQQEGLSFANPDMVSNMVFSAGGFEAKYGDKLSSVLDITYKKPRSFGGNISGSLLGGSLQLEGISKNKLLSWQIGSRYKSNQYLLKNLDTKGEYMPRFYDIQSLLSFNISPEFTLECLSHFSGNKYLVTPETRETVFGTFNEALQFKVYFDGQEVSNFNTMFGAVSATYKPNPKLQLKLISSAFNTQESETFTVQGQFYINQLNNDFGNDNFGSVAYNKGIGTFINNGRNYLDATVLNLEHKGKLTTEHRNEWLWGVRVQHEEINDKLGEWNYVDSAGYSIPQLSPNLVELRDVLKTNIHLSSERIMAYGEYVYLKEYQDTAHLTLTAGVRTNYWTLNNQNVISPRATLAYQPNWKYNWVFKASCGFYYQPPFYREMRDLKGNVNTNLKAQQSVHYVVSGDLNFSMWKRPFKFITALYFKQMNELVPYEIDNVRIRYFANNNAKGYATGIDVRLNGEFIKGVESWASMSVMTIREKISNEYYNVYLNSDGQEVKYGMSNVLVTDTALKPGGYIPRPTDQLVTFNLFFQDYLPKVPDCKMHLNLIFGSGLPFWIPNHKKYPFGENQRFPFYRRVDVGFSYQVLKEERFQQGKQNFRFIRSAWLSAEVLNLLSVNNVVSYTWLKDFENKQYAVPNYLTNRQLNVKLQFRF